MDFFYLPYLVVDTSDGRTRTEELDEDGFCYSKEDKRADDCLILV